MVVPALVSPPGPGVPLTGSRPASRSLGSPLARGLSLFMRLLLYLTRGERPQRDRHGHCTRNPGFVPSDGRPSGRRTALARETKEKTGKAKVGTSDYGAEPTFTPTKSAEATMHSAERSAAWRCFFAA